MALAGPSASACLLHRSRFMHELLLRAIRERRLLMFAYRDTLRIVEAHRYGEAANGHRLLNAWMRPGNSRTDPDGGWRNFLLEDISAPQLLDETFAGAREGYAPRDRGMVTVFAELAATPADATARTDAAAKDDDDDDAESIAHHGHAGEPGHGDYHEPPDAKHIDTHVPRKDEIGA